jgi:DNA helicase-2/ATP-dependent DNA helicase PcrA
MESPTAPDGKRIGSLADAELASSGRFLIIAGPGSGKTSLIVGRVRALLEADDAAKRGLLVLTFTNKAALEVSTRLNLDSEQAAGSNFVGTFHAFGSKLLRSHGDLVGIPSNFVLYNRDDQLAFITELQDAGQLPDTAAAYDLSRAIGHEKELASARISDSTGLDDLTLGLPEYVRIYQKALRAVRGLDFSDLIFESNRLLFTAPYVLDLYRTIYTHVFVDEFQDTTPAQYLLLRKLISPTDGNLFAVADEDQLIFEWNEARLDTLNRYCDDFSPGVLYSTLSHRCPRQIVLAANAVIRKNRFRFPSKPDIGAAREASVPNPIRLVVADSENAEFEEIAGDIARLVGQGEPPSEIAVIARAKWLLDGFESALGSIGIGASRPTLGGLGETEEAKIVVGVLRWVLNEWDEPSVRRVIGLLVPEASLRLERSQALARASGISLEAALLAADPDGSNPESKLISKVAGLRMQSGSAALLLDSLVEDLLPSLVELAGGDAKGREVSRVVLGLQTISARLFPRREIALFEFLMNIPNLTQPIVGDDQAAAQATVSLLTCHQAKGTEFNHVYAPCLEEDILPDYRQARNLAGLEAERRLFYVTLTRAKARITLSSSRSRANASGVSKPRRPSRFIAEIPADLIHPWIL